MYDTDLGYHLNKILSKGVQQDKADETARRICMEVGVEPVAYRELCTYKELKEKIRERAGELIKDEADIVEMTIELMFSCSATDDVLEKDGLQSLFAHVAGQTSKSYADMESLARFTTPHELDFKTKIDKDLATWLYISGPMAFHEFPKRWWAIPEPPKDTFATQYGVLSGFKGIFISYRKGSSEVRTVRLSTKKKVSLKSLIPRTAHLLTASQREKLHSLVGDQESSGGEGQWESVDVPMHEIPINTENPDFHTLQYHGTKDVNLQSVSETMLVEYKEAMDVTFQASAISRDDPNYEYDSRLQVAPTEKSKWDSSSEEENS